MLGLVRLVQATLVAVFRSRQDLVLENLLPAPGVVQASRVGTLFWLLSRRLSLADTVGGWWRCAAQILLAWLAALLFPARISVGQAERRSQGRRCTAGQTVLIASVACSGSTSKPPGEVTQPVNAYIQHRYLRRQPRFSNMRPQHADRATEDFDRLYVATYHRIFRTLTSMLGDVAAAEDCTQEAFLKAFKAWRTWKQDAPAEAWLHRIAINTAVSYKRRQALRDVGELVRRLGWPLDQHPVDGALVGDLLRELRRLPAKQAAAIVLRHLHGYTNREIAVALGVPESTVATRVMTAKRTLRARLGDSEPAVFDTSAPWRVSSIE